MNIPYKRPVDEALVERICNFLGQSLENTSRVDLRNVLFGLSGGVDSVVVGGLCRRSFANCARLSAVTVDLGRPGETERIARIRDTAARLDVEHIVIDGAAARADVLGACDGESPFRNINVDTRLINTLIFQVADCREAAVIVTTDKSELIMGRYTEAFYGHIAPIINLYKTELYELADLLSVNDAVCDKRAGCEDYWYDDEVFGTGYDILDPILYLFTERGYEPKQLSREFRFEDVEWLENLYHRVRWQRYRVGTQQLDLTEGGE